MTRQNIVQWRAISRILGLQGRTHKKLLQELGVITLEEMRHWVDSTVQYSTVQYSTVQDGK
jgi:hypothetical protein